MRARDFNWYYLLPFVMFLAGVGVGAFAASAYGELPGVGGAVPKLAEEKTPEESAGEGRISRVSETTQATAAGAPKTQESDRSSAKKLENEDLEARLEAMIAAWTQMRSDMARLQAQVDSLTQKLSSTVNNSATLVRRSRPRTPEERQSALVRAGLTQNRAADIVWRQSQQELDRLDLRDIAVREGWFGTDRYREELSVINESTVDLREEIGEDHYDHYLFATGADNRVRVDSIIPGSVADDAGLRSGDFIESYAGARIFTFRDLRAATSEGTRGELVPVRVRRGEGAVDLWLSRGPLGVRLERMSIDPDT